MLDRYARPENENTVDVHDPQNALGDEVDEKMFTKCVNEEIGLRLFTISLDKFEETIEKYYPENKRIAKRRADAACN